MSRLTPLLPLLPLPPLLLLLLTACYPGGYSEQEWKSLTPQQQHEVRLKQLEADQARAEADQARAEADAELARRATEVYRYDYDAQQQPREDLKQPMRTGDVMIVAFVSGSIRSNNTRVHFRPAVYEVWRGQSRQVILRPDPGFQQPPVIFTLSIPESGTELHLIDGSEQPIILPRQRWEEGYLYRTSDASARSLQPIDLTVFVRIKQF